MIGLFYGTRPEYIKLRPIIDEFISKSVKYKLFKVKQHDSLLSGCNFDHIIDIDDISSNRLKDITISVLKYKLPEELDYVLVQGDTTTAMAVALNAFNSDIPVMHVEAGLRTFDKENPFPEEVNRRIISGLATIHYCPTFRDLCNLTSEGVVYDYTMVTGNTSIDNIKHIKPSKGNQVIVTLHRRENHSKMREWFEAVEKLAVRYPEYDFLFPMHPNPGTQKHRDIFKKVTVCDPIPFDEMKQLLASCALVITDSGGIQEECSFFKKVCLICRKATERPSKGGMLCKNTTSLVTNFDKYHKLEITSDCEYGDGNAAKKITEDILKRI